MSTRSATDMERYGLLLDLRDPGFDDDVVPLHVLVRNEFSELRGRHDDGLCALLGEALAHGRVVEGLIDRLVDGCDHVLGCALRRQQREPAGILVAGEPGFRRGRDIRQRLHARLVGDCQRPRALGLQGRQHVGKPLEAERHRSGDHVRSVLRDVAIGHVGELGAGQLLEIGSREVLRAADTDRAVVETGMLLGVGDQLGERVYRQLGARHHDDGEHGDERDRLEVLLHVIAEVTIERAIGGHRPRAGRDQVVAVGGGLGRSGSAVVAAGARPVVDDEGVAQLLAGAVEQDARDHVARTAARERDDHLDRPGGVGVGACGGAGQERRAERTTKHRACGDPRRAGSIHGVSSGLAQLPLNLAGRLAWNASTPSRKSSDCRSRL